MALWPMITVVDEMLVREIAFNVSTVPIIIDHLEPENLSVIKNIN